ncbi:MAG TPA: hypothetical protein VM243_06570 [Phycisphaerae bacterium]|nr:hypothetical protein [Phycisphaerae bacterium]
MSFRNRSNVFATLCLTPVVALMLLLPACTTVSSGGNGDGDGPADDQGGGFTITGETFSAPIGQTGQFQLDAAGGQDRTAARIDIFSQMPTDSPSQATLFIEPQNVQFTGQAGAASVRAYIAPAGSASPCDEGLDVGAFALSYDGSAFTASVTDLPLTGSALSYVRSGAFAICLAATGDMNATLQITTLAVRFAPPVGPVPDGGDTPEPDGGDTPEPDGDEPPVNEIAFTQYTNAGDPLMFSATTPEGENLEYYAEKDADGFPVRLTAMRHQSAEQVGTDEATWIHFGEDDRPNRFIGSDGSIIDMQWSSDTEVLVTGVTGDGSYQINTLLDLEEGLDDQTQKYIAARLRAAAQGSPRAGRRITLTPQECQAIADSGMCLETDVIKRPATTHKAAAGAAVNVEVIRCGATVDDASVYLAYDSPWSGGTARSYPAFPLGLGGGYQATIPLPEPAVDGQTVQDMCAKFKADIDALCTVSPAVAAVSGTWLCLKLSAAIDLVAGGPTGEAVPIFAACETALTVYLGMCAAMGTGPVSAPPGTPGISDFVCNNIKKVVDVLAAPEPVSMEIQAYANVPGQGLKTSGPQIVSSIGPFPNFSIDFGGSPSIDSFSTSPADPGPDEGYVAEVKVSCASGGTVTIAVAGTDDYSDSVTADITSEEYVGTLTVPGGDAGVTDTISVLVQPSLLDGLEQPSVSKTIALVF